MPLPDPKASINQVSRFGLSVQLWSPNRVLDLQLRTVDTTTTSPYKAVVSAYDRSTRGLICTTDNNTCPSVGAAWLDAANQFAAGDMVLISEYYNRTSGYDQFTVSDQTSGQSLGFRLADSTSELYGGARVVAEFGCSPWAACAAGPVAYKPPLAETHLVTFTTTRLTTYSGLKTSLSAPWTHSKFFMTADGTSSMPVEVAPHALWNSGQNFGIYYEPAI